MKVGLVVNPVAGVGGRVGLKGSDGADVQERAFALGAVARAGERATVALRELRTRRPETAVLTAAGAMGEEPAREAGLNPMVVYAPGDPTSPADTVAAARILAPQVDLLLFAGGDGTARDVLEAVGDSVPVLGIPTGVKMHSAVFAVNPRAAGEVAVSSSRLRDAEVVDRVDGTTRLFGHLRVPDLPSRVQQRKTGSSGITPDAVSGIAAELLELGGLLVLGPGTTTRAIAALWGIDVPVLGVNVLAEKQLIAADVSADELLKLLADTDAGSDADIGTDLDICTDIGTGTGSRIAATSTGATSIITASAGSGSRSGSASGSRSVSGSGSSSSSGSSFGTRIPVHIAITPIGGQGFLLGRGNQQLAPEVLRRVGLDRLRVVATEAKLAALGGRPFHVDTGDAALDHEFPAYLRVITGYHRTTLYPLERA